MSSDLICISQSAHFSCAHKYANDQLSETENQKLYGSDYSAQGLGNNFQAMATVCGPASETTGQVWNHEDFQRQLVELVSLFDHRFAGPEIAGFGNKVSSLENMALFLAKELSQKVPAGVELRRFRLFEDQNLWADVFAPEGGRLRLTKAYRIRCVHRHHNPDLSMEENKRLYHKCSAVHGHEYRIEVTLQGEVDGVTGLLMPRPQLDQIVKSLIVDPLDGQFLNDHLGNTSGEIISERFYRILKSQLPNLLTVSLRETRKNSFFYVPETLKESEIVSVI